MSAHLREPSHGFLQEVFDAIPAMVLVVDDDVRIQLLNSVASEGFGLNLADVRHKRTGEVLHCIHTAITEESCGHSEFCQDCAIRNSVTLAMKGYRTHRQSVGMVLLAGREKKDIHLLVSASPIHWRGKQFVVLTLENISDLLRLQNLIPICMHCHKIRDEQGSWQSFLDYFKQQIDIDFSHGICPQCVSIHYPMLKKRSQ